MVDITTDRSLYEDRWRVDTISGVRKPAVKDGNYKRTSDTLRKLGDSTPNFGYYVRTGTHKPENAYLYRREQAVMPRGSPHLHLTYIPNGDTSDYFGPCDGSNQYGNIAYLQPSPAVRTQIANNMDMRLRSKIKGQKVNLGNFLAERNQTLSLFGDTAKRLANAVNALRAKRFADAFRHLRCPPSKRVNPSKSLANNWLELQYGWLPLLDDCYGASEELADAWNDQKKKTNYVRAAVKFRWAESDVTSAGNQPGSVANRNAIMDFTRWCYYTVDYESSAFLGRVGLTNPLDIAWEATPWSFVVDWFLPVGRFLNTLDATLGCSFHSGGNAGKLFSHIEYYRLANYVVGNFRYEWNVPPVKARYFTYERGSLSAFPAVHLPQLKNPLSAQHCANALALLTQAFSRK